MDEPIVIDRRAPTAPPTGSPEGSWSIRFATFFGVPALIAVYLVWSLVSGQSTVLINIERLLYAQQAQVAEVSRATKETAAATTAVSIRIESYMRQICVNGAKTLADRNTCLSVR